MMRYTYATRWPPSVILSLDLRLPHPRACQVRVVGITKAVAGTDTAFYDIVHALWTRMITQDPPDVPTASTGALACIQRFLSQSHDS